MSLFSEAEIERLTIAERLELLERVWDSLLSADQLPPMPRWHEEELARRVASANANPGASISLEQLRDELNGRSV